MNPADIAAVKWHLASAAAMMKQAGATDAQIAAVLHNLSRKRGWWVKWLLGRR